MQYRTLGRTGIKVSPYALGALALGTSIGNPGHGDSVRIIYKALDAGINVIDTADAYGESEVVVGKALKGRGVPAMPRGGPASAGSGRRSEQGNTRQRTRVRGLSRKARSRRGIVIPGPFGSLEIPNGPYFHAPVPRPALSSRPRPGRGCAGGPRLSASPAARALRQANHRRLMSP